MVTSGPTCVLLDSTTAMDPLHDLIVRTQRGDMHAAEALVRLTQAMAYAVARRVLRDRHAAEDAVQQAYLQAFRRLATFRTRPPSPRGSGASSSRPHSTAAEPAG